MYKCIEFIYWNIGLSSTR